MAYEKVLVDSNVVVDLLARREPFYEGARLLALAGCANEVSIWISASQVTDLIYVLSEGGKKSRMPHVLESLRTLLSFVRVFAVDEQAIRAVLDTDWADAEDALVHEVARRLEADAIITRNQKDFEKSLVPVHDCDSYFRHLEADFGLSYSELGL